MCLIIDINISIFQVSNRNHVNILRRYLQSYCHWTCKLLRSLHPPYNRRKESSWCSYYIIILYNVNDLRVSLKSHGTYCFGFHINILFSMEFTRRLQLCSVLHIWLSGGQEVIVDEMVWCEIHKYGWYCSSSRGWLDSSRSESKRLGCFRSLRSLSRIWFPLSLSHIGYWNR